MLNTNLHVMMQIVLHIFKTKCGQERHWENKHKCENNKNIGNIVVKQEEDQTKVQEQLNVSNVSNASNTSTRSSNSRGSQKKKKNKTKQNKNLVILDKQKQKEILS